MDDLEKKVINKNFINKNQIEKRKILEEHLLNEKTAKKGIKVLCFEDREVEPDQNLYIYQIFKKKNKTYTPNLSTCVGITIGKYYEVLDIKPGEIKILNDLGHNKWYRHKRFIYSLKMERSEKIKKIQSNLGGKKLFEYISVL